MSNSEMGYCGEGGGGGGGHGGLPEKNLDISASGKCILEDPEDGFVVDNNASHCTY